MHQQMPLMDRQTMCVYSIREIQTLIQAHQSQKSDHQLLYKKAAAAAKWTRCTCEIVDKNANPSAVRDEYYP